MNHMDTAPGSTDRPDKPIHILIVEDEAPLRHLLSSSLRRVGYEPHCALTGEHALQLFDEFHQAHEQDMDLVLMDVVMPGMGGYELCAALREVSDVPVIMLTALSRTDDIVRGFDLGADDYIVKPFIFREVEARVKAVLRRAQWQEQPPDLAILSSNGILLDTQTGVASVRGEAVALTPIESALLTELMRHPNHTIDKHTLFQKVWGYEGREARNMVEVAMRRLRMKIERDVADPKILVTVPNFGYKFHAPSTGSPPESARHDPASQFGSS